MFRQAKENSARHGLNAVAMARQAALLLLAVNGYEIPPYAVTNDYYRQALELRIPRGMAGEIYAAMGITDRTYFSHVKKLLVLCDEALEFADRFNVDEGLLRPLTGLEPADQVEMLQQIIQLNLNAKQVQAIVENGIPEIDEASSDDLPAYVTKFARMLMRDGDKFEPEILWQAVYREKGDPHLAQAYLKRLAQLALSAAERYENG